MSFVSPERTGRLGFTVIFRGPNRQSATFGNPDGPITWTESRFAVLFMAAKHIGYSDSEADRMAEAGMVVWANESGWGRNEWRWNGFGCHCYESMDCMRFNDPNDPQLAAFPNIDTAALKFWSLAMADSQVATLFREGRYYAANQLTSTEFGGGGVLTESECLSIFNRVRRYLGRSQIQAESSSSSSSRSSRSKWVLGLAALAALAASMRK